jgi:transcriptional regulator with XRE-family HTH domain
MTSYTKRIAGILAHNLRFERLERQMIQEEVATRAKMSLRQYQKLELAQANATIETLCSLAQVFGITVDQWMRVCRIRTELSAELFLEYFQTAFHKVDLAAGIRTLQGVVLWGNSATQSLGLTVHNKEPFDLMKYLKGPALEILKVQLNGEQRGIVSTYTNYVKDPKSRRMNILRYYPVLIYPRHGTQAHFAALYITKPESDSHLGYYKFCERLLGII